MSFIFDQLIFIAMGVFISFFAKLFKMHPISVKTEILGVMIGLGLVWLTRHCYEGFYSMSFPEQVKLLLLGYLPMRIIRWPKSNNDE